MLILETAAVAFSMFSALPVPQPVWNQRNMRYAMCAFPLVGLVLGALWWCWAALCCRLALPELLRGAGLCLLPVAVTGGIHLDGYADTSDALASHAPPERRREILSDSHCGAFAIIRLCTYFVGYFALCTAVDPTEPAALCMGLSFALSRAMSGFAITAFPLAKDTGLAHTFASAAHRGRARTILVVTMLLTGPNSVGSQATWPAGLCRERNFGCWRRWWPASRWRSCYDIHYRTAVCRKAAGGDEAFGLEP